MLVDDEKSMLMIMKQLLSKIAGVEVAGSFQKAADALDFVRKTPVDIAFIDISIAEDNGLELARSMLAVHSGLTIVFVTSHREFALEAFDMYAFDYMVKPISRERLERTIARAASMRRPDHAHAERSSRLFVRGFGGLEVNVKPGEAVKWRSAKSEELLVYLLVQKGRSTAKERILEDIFPDMTQKNAELYLNTAVYQLRKTLASDGQKTSVIRVNDQYRLHLEEASVDFIDFELQVSRLEDLEDGDLDAACETEQLFAGPLFEGKSYMWAMAERERLSDIYADYAKRVGRLLLERRQFTRAAKVVKKLVGLMELDEDANALLLEVYAAMKDRQGLIRHYDKFTQLLERELKVKPTSELDQLYKLLLGSHMN